RARLWRDDPRFLLLEYEEEALLNRNRREWTAYLPDWLRGCVEFERGLPGRARLKASVFLEHAGDDWSLVPVHDFQLEEAAGVWQSLFDCPLLEGITVLNLHQGHIGAAGAARLSACPFLSNLRDLCLAYNDIGAEGARALAHSTCLPSLTRLNLSECALGRA